MVTFRNVEVTKWGDLVEREVRRVKLAGTKLLEPFNKYSGNSSSCFENYKEIILYSLLISWITSEKRDICSALNCKYYPYSCAFKYCFQVGSFPWCILEVWSCWRNYVTRVDGFESWKTHILQLIHCFMLAVQDICHSFQLSSCYHVFFTIFYSQNTLEL